MFRTLKRAGDYVLVFRHDSSGGLFFSSKEDAKNIGGANTDSLYSVLYQLEDFRYNGKFQFKLVYPRNGITNIWKQSTNFATATTGGVTGYEAISIGNGANGWAGIEYNTGSYSLADGSVGSDTCYFAIGATTSWSTGTQIPGPQGAVDLVELWVYYPTSTQIKEAGVFTNHFNEVGKLKKLISVTGVSALSTVKQSLKINGTEVLTAGMLAATSGIVLTVLNDNFTVKDQVNYDTLSTTSRTNFVAKMGTLSNELFIIQSVGPMKSETAMDAVFWNLKSVDWRGTAYYDKWNYRYAAIGLAGLGIFNERCFFDSTLEPDAITKVSLDDKTDAGMLGFGKPIIEIVNPGPNIVTFASSDVSFKTDQKIVVGASGRVSRSMFLASQTAVININYYAGATLLGINPITFGSCGVAEKKDLVFAPPAGTTKIAISTTNDDAVLDYVSVRYAGTGTINTQIRINDNGIAMPLLCQSPVSASVYNPNEWLKLHGSNSNLVKSILIKQDENAPVQFGNTTLTLDTQRAYWSGINTNVSSEQVVPIDCTQLYFCSTWVYVIEKSAGSVIFGCLTRDSAGNTVNLIGPDGTAMASPFFQEADSSLIQTGRWMLFYGWLLPSTWTQAQCLAFGAKNKNYFGTLGGYNVGTNGLSPTNSGTTGYKVAQMQSNATTVSVFTRDSYNNTTSQSTMMIALPVVSHVNVAAVAPDKMFALELIDI